MTDKEQVVFNKTMTECNRSLGSIGMSWNFLSDTQAISDWIDEDMDDDAVKDVALDLCWNKLYDNGMDRDAATELIYGKEALDA